MFTVNGIVSHIHVKSNEPMNEQDDKKVLFIKLGSISRNDKAKLTKAGYVVIMSSVDDPIIVQKSEPPHLIFTNCYSCGERVYMTEERLTALKENGKGFYCSHGHSTAFKKSKPQNQ